MNTTTCNRCKGTGFVQGMGHVARGRCFKCDGAGFIAPKDAPVVAAPVAAFEGALPVGTAIKVGGLDATVVSALSNGRYVVKMVGRAGTRFVDAAEVIA